MTGSLLGLPPARTAPDEGLIAHLRTLVAAEDPPSPELPRTTVDGLVTALLAVEDDARSRYRALGLSDETAAATLADVGRKVAAYGADVDGPWLVGLLRADVVAAGRLQVTRVPHADGASLHVPEGGPLTPEVVDSALRQVRSLLGPVPLHCTSWLLDPTLDALPPTSNIRRFAARFDVTPTQPGAEGVHDVCRFVFRRPVRDVLDPDLVTPRTSLERLVAAHLRAGGSWSVPHGDLRDD
ncbi:DUF5596 domain-containing protein [Phycicoccus sp. CSK15P-2]|uniref:acyltransferase domain-containing protein n=1 Tax=Phycicoccus sp. CSK15P-2 TaxID=2807627 RepID=UPI00194F6F59|nr:acyltransferase domain-containing protein [Phycicoccus sp. CSK15P-2]MBM6405866.1 DUF5596 domain-containing protein [Phycicoccus sp. CSK15P-2]